MGLDLLLSEGPAADRAQAMGTFGRLVGRWDTHITYLRDGVVTREVSGEWEFSYALEGRAVIDVWQAPARDVAARTGVTAECGLCVRVYDPVLDLWRFTFHGPVSRTTVNMIAMPTRDEIVQECVEESGLLRWVFFDIQPDRFSWRAERSPDGANWTLEQRVEARRI
jgi:hypothetical protein